MTKDIGALNRPYPQLLDQSEAKALLIKAENLWSDSQANNLGGFSGINRPFYILHEFKSVIEEFGNRDVGLSWSKDQLDAARAVAPVVQGYPGLPMSDAELSKHYEASKIDAVSLVGSEVRQIIGELRHHRAHPPHPAPVDPVAGGEALREALTPDEMGLTDVECVAILLEGYARDAKRNGLPATAASHDRAAGMLRMMAAALAALKGPAA